MARTQVNGWSTMDVMVENNSSYEKAKLKTKICAQMQRESVSCHIACLQQ